MIEPERAARIEHGAVVVERWSDDQGVTVFVDVDGQEVVVLGESVDCLIKALQEARTA